MIDKYIEIIKNSSLIKKGSNKVCYIFDDVVLLKGSFVNNGEEDIIRKNKLDKLYDNGVNVCRVLESKIINNEKYELQERAKGEELFHLYAKPTKEEQLHFLKTLDSLSKQDISFFEEFLVNWNKILEMGFDVDPSKSTNFFYDGKSISFIDLNITNNYEIRRPWMLREAAVVLRGGGLLWRFTDVYEEANEKIKIIYQKLGKAAIELGEDVEEYINYFDSSGEYGLADYLNSYKK